MTADSENLTFRHFAGADEPSRSDVERVYSAAYRRAIESGDPFDSVDAFMDRYDHYVRTSGFHLVMMYADGAPIGQTWGWPLGPTSRWWSGLKSEPEPNFTAEDGTRTFALSEIMVAEEFAGRGLAHRLHDELLKNRTEKRATLLVESDNNRARRAYVRWGWMPVAELRPDWPNAPRFEVLIRALATSL